MPSFPQSLFTPITSTLVPSNPVPSNPSCPPDYSTSPDNRNTDSITTVTTSQVPISSVNIMSSSVNQTNSLLSPDQTPRIPESPVSHDIVETIIFNQETVSPVSADAIVLNNNTTELVNQSSFYESPVEDLEQPHAVPVTQEVVSSPIINTQLVKQPADSALSSTSSKVLPIPDDPISSTNVTAQLVDQTSHNVASPGSRTTSEPQTTRNNVRAPGNCACLHFVYVLQLVCLQAGRYYNQLFLVLQGIL